MIEAFTRLDSEILALENLAPGARLTTAEAWVEHLENMQLKVDDMTSDKPPLDVISEIDESILDDEKTPASAMERERNDIVKVKNVCTCRINWSLDVLSKLMGCYYASNQKFPFLRGIICS